MSTATKTRTAGNLPIADVAERLGLSLGALQLQLHRQTFPIAAIQYTDKGKRYFPAGAVEALATGGKAGLTEYRSQEQASEKFSEESF